MIDILIDYITATEKKKLVISTFFKKERSNILTYCNNLQPNVKNLDLKMYWAQQIEEFASVEPKILI
jgi:hypothetical protein